MLTASSGPTSEATGLPEKNARQNIRFGETVLLTGRINHLPKSRAQLHNLLRDRARLHVEGETRRIQRGGVREWKPAQRSGLPAKCIKSAANKHKVELNEQDWRELT